MTVALNPICASFGSNHLFQLRGPSTNTVALNPICSQQLDRATVIAALQCNGCNYESALEYLLSKNLMRSHSPHMQEASGKQMHVLQCAVAVVVTRFSVGFYSFEEAQERGKLCSQSHCRKANQACCRP